MMTDSARNPSGGLQAPRPARFWAGPLTVTALVVFAVTTGGCAGGKVNTNGVPIGGPGRYHPAQLEINVAGGALGRSLDHVVVDLYGPAEFARRGGQFAPDSRQAGFMLKPNPSGGSPYWEYYSEGRPMRLAHQPGLLILRGADGRVNTSAVSAGDAGSELHRMLWGADPNLNHLRASDPNGLALPLIRTLWQTPSIRNNPAFVDWYNGFQQWHQAATAANNGGGATPPATMAPPPGGYAPRPVSPAPAAAPLPSTPALSPNFPPTAGMTIAPLMR